MNITVCLTKAAQILDEERNSPTLQYEIAPKELTAGMSGDYATLIQGLAALNGNQALANIRSKRPRPVQENPRCWIFKSINYNLLCALNAEVASDSRAAFARGLLQRIARPSCGRAKLTTDRPRWNDFVSELPLIAEFCVRNVAKGEFLLALQQAKP